MVQPYMSVKELAELLKIRPETVNKWVRDGKLECFQVTVRIRRFSPEQIDCFLNPRIVHSPNKLQGNRTILVPSGKKGGGKREKKRDSDRAQLMKEMRSWQ